MTSISVHKKGKDHTVFLLKDTTPGFVNALRRTIMDHTPTMAIHEVEFSKNSSALYDEIIAHRLGLLVLTTDLKSYDVKKSEDEEDTAKTTLKLWMKAKGPGYVYAEDIKTGDPAVKPVFPKTPIVKLLKDQELEFQAIAQLGFGRDHVKWSPAHAWHTYFPKVTIKKQPDGAWKEKYPPQAFDGAKLSAKKIDELNLYDAIDGVNNDIAQVEYDSSAFLLHVEPFGQLKAKDIVFEAFEQLKKNFELLQTTL